MPAHARAIADASPTIWPVLNLLPENMSPTVIGNIVVVVMSGGYTSNTSDVVVVVTGSTVVVLALTMVVVVVVVVFDLHVLDSLNCVVLPCTH